MSDGTLDPESAATTVGPNRTGWGARWIVVGLLVLGCGGVLWFVLPRPDPPAGVSLLPFPFKIPSDKGPLPDRLIPQKWGWLWRMKYAVMGKQPVIQLRAEIFMVSPERESPWPEPLKTRPPAAQTNGVRAWMVPAAELDELRQRLKHSSGYAVLESPRTTTGHRVRTTLTVNQTVSLDGASVPVGLTTDFFTVARGRTIEMTAVVSYSETVQEKVRSEIGSLTYRKLTGLRTNLAVAAKMWLPSGNGVLVLQSSTEGSNQVLRGMLLSGTIERPK